MSVKGGGVTYQIASGKQMPWEDVPEWFKDRVNEQDVAEETSASVTSCDAMKLAAQKCIEQHGFWHEECSKLTDAFHLCQGNALRQFLPPKSEAASGSGDPRK